MTIRTIALAALLCFAIVPGCVAQTEVTDHPNIIPAAPSSSVVIGANDSITIVALQSDEISKNWRVSSAGDLDLPMVGKIHAAGMTTDELQQELTTRLKRFIRDPQVTAYISEFRSQPITVAGGVERPGTFQIEGPKTLLTVLMMAGGVVKTPGPTVTVTRDKEFGTIPLSGAHTVDGGARSTIDLPLKDVLVASTPAANLEIRPHDVISVSTQQRLVYILGEVTRPGAVELVTQDSVSVMQVLAAAGGLTKVAAPGHTEIMRMDSQGLYKKVASIDLKRVMTGKIEDRLLTSGDIIVVPSSNLKIYSQVASMTAITTGMYILTRF